jgi:hypothetical protein
VKDGQGYTFSQTLESTLLLCSPKTQKGEVEKELKNTQHVEKAIMNIKSCVHHIVANKIVCLTCACKWQLWWASFKGTKLGEFFWSCSLCSIDTLDTQSIPTPQRQQMQYRCTRQLLKLIYLIQYYLWHHLLILSHKTDWTFQINIAPEIANLLWLQLQILLGSCPMGLNVL